MSLSLNSAAGCPTRRLFLSVLMTALVLAAGTLGIGAEMSELAPLASRSLLLDITWAGSQLVTVGEHGHVLLSADQGKSWKQCTVPSRALLTAVSFADAAHGWVVGHDGTILVTADGGQTWNRQDRGENLNSIYLDVLFLDPSHGFICGAYGKFLTTSDGGKTWQPSKPVDEEVHYNRLARATDGTLYLAGEGGLFLRSVDEGKRWTRDEVPYQGSLFGIVPLGRGAVAVSGLRGHIFVTAVGSANWEPREVEPKVLLMSGIVASDGRLIFAGTGGNFFFSSDAGRMFTHWKPADFGTSIADLIGTADGWIITVGEAGAVRIKLP